MAGGRAGIYTRISQDSAGDRLGVRRQERECRELAELLDVVVVDVYEDDDVSAFSKAGRPQFDRLLGDVRAGVIDTVIAWHADRLYRRQRDLVPFIDTVHEAGAMVATVTAGAVDLSSASGRMTARVVGAVAEHESEIKGQRLRSKHAQLQRQGRWNGSRTLPAEWSLALSVPSPSMSPSTSPNDSAPSTRRSPVMGVGSAAIRRSAT